MITTTKERERIQIIAYNYFFWHIIDRGYVSAIKYLSPP